MTRRHLTSYLRSTWGKRNHSNMIEAVCRYEGALYASTGMRIGGEKKYENLIFYICTQPLIMVLELKLRQKISSIFPLTVHGLLEILWQKEAPLQHWLSALLQKSMTTLTLSRLGILTLTRVRSCFARWCFSRWHKSSSHFQQLSAASLCVYTWIKMHKAFLCAWM